MFQILQRKKNFEDPLACTRSPNGKLMKGESLAITLYGGDKIPVVALHNNTR